MFASLVCIALWSAEPTIPTNVRELMQDRNYQGAIAAIDEALKKPDVNVAALEYLRAKAMYLQGNFAPAAKAFLAVAEKHPKSSTARQARFAAALAQTRMGDFRSAEAIYKDLAISILSEDRQQETALLYLEFADLYFKPPKEDQKPDYAKALAFYKKALEAGPKPEKKIEVELRIARCHQELNQHQEAVNLLKQFVKTNAKHASVVEGMYLLGDSHLKLGQLADARRVWQDLLDEHGKADSPRIVDARYELSKTYSMPNPPNDEYLERGVASLEAFVKDYPTDKRAAKAALEIGQAYLARGRSEQGIAALNKLISEERFAKSDEVADARVLLGRMYASQKKFDEALAAFADYLAKHPAHSGWSQVQSEIIETENAKALELRKDKKYADARKLWEAFLVKYPLYGNAANIMLEFGKMNFEQDKFAEAIADWRKLIAKYPNTDPSSWAQFRIAQTLEEKLKQPEEALKEYRKVTWGAAQQSARQRIAWLTSKGMIIATERVFRSNETPKVKLTSRNIDAVNVRAWSVDLETYFRKMHLARGVESLDIALIDPDKSFEFKPEKYAEYREIESQIPIEAGPAGNKPGVYAVTVSGKTLEATTLVIRSDLEILVKASRDEIFVFAQNLRTGKPWANVRLLISNGSKVFAEAVTGEDGVFKKSFEELKASNDVRVFAIADNHTASNIVGLQGLGVATGVSPRGYIYTDRPGYRAGQLVHIRGIVRDVANDEYTIPKGRKLKLEVYDPRNRTLKTESVTLGDFGGFHSHVILPRETPPGVYRVAVREDNGRSYEHTFQVAEYRLEPINIKIDTDRAVFYRGEKIEGTISVGYYYGVPAVEKEIRYQLTGEDQTVHTAKTDKDGKIKFSFDTRQFRESQTLTLSAVMPEFNLQTAKNFVISTVGFNISVSTPRSVYVQGESFETTVNVKDAEGKPVGTKLTLRVMEKTTVNEKTGERLAESQEITTDPKTGIGKATFTLAKGATYVVRAEGIDRFKNVVTGEKAVVLSDDKDRVRLRILAERLTYRVGDTAEVVVHWREDNALALVTYQGAKVLGYELVELSKGANRIKIPVKPALAPNFELAVNVMTDSRPTEDRKTVLRLHTATTPVTVERDLILKLVTKRKDGKAGPPAPGDEVDVTVTATDAQGNPVVTEVSLAAVEQALLDQFGASSNDNPIGAFFLGTSRQVAVRTGSSVTFSYSPRTVGINEQTLAESEREEIARMEAAARVAEIDGVAEPRGEHFFRDELSGMLGARPGDRGSVVGAPGLGGGGGTRGDVRFTPPSANPNAPALPQKAAGYGGDLTAKAPSGRSRQMRQLRESGAGLQGKELAQDKAESLVDLQDQSRGLERFENVNAQILTTNSDFAIQFKHPTLDDLRGWAEKGGNEIQTWNYRDGRYGNISFGRKLAAANSALERNKVLTDIVEAARAEGAVVVPSQGPQETAYWNPGVVTDQAGKAVISFVLPERSTAWRIIAKGITATTLAGEADGTLVAKKSLFGELKMPIAFTDGDKSEIEASIINDEIAEGEITVTLAVGIADKTQTETKKIAATKGRHSLRFPVTITRKEGAGPMTEANFTLTIAAGGKSDVLRRTAAVKPFGMNVYSASGGSANSDTTVFVDAPAGMTVSSPGLQILVGPNVERSLLDILFGVAPWCQIETARLGAGVETTVSDLQAALALQKLIGGARNADGPRTQTLDERVRSSIGGLVAAQLDDGGWVWAKAGAGSNHFVTSRVLWALSDAKRAGYSVPPETLTKAIANLKSRMAQLPNTDTESTAVVLHALSTAGEGDFAVANRLHRSRPTLSNAGLAYLSLTFVEMNRKQMAAELLALLGQRGFDANPTEKCLPWNSGEAEMRALVCLAEQRVNASSPRIKPQVDWLLAHRTGHRWAPDKATGPAAAALCEWFGRSRFSGEKYKLDVFVNDALFESLEIEGDSQSRLLEVPAERLVKQGKQRVQFRLTGRGQYTYQCVYGGFVPADALKSTYDEYRVQRYYEPAPLEVDGKQVPRGFDVLQGTYKAFRNPLTQLPVAKRGLVVISFSHQNRIPDGPQAYPYLVVTEPIPAGATVDEKSISGNVERYEISEGSITFYLGAQYGHSGRYWIPTIQYALTGYVPGDYKVAPTVLRDAYRPERMMVAKPATLKVLPMGSKSADEYRLSPRELFELGKINFEKKNLKEAGAHLTELFTKWNLHPETYKETARLLLETHLETGPSASVVKYFEIIKEKYPDLQIPFAKILKVGSAYHDMGEYERSFLIFRATVEAAFQKESEAGGFLETQGEFLRSVTYMRRLTSEFPPEPYVAGATYALAQRVYAKAEHAAADPKLREKRLGRTAVTRQAVGMFDDFLTLYPEDPAADQAAFALANGLLDMKAYQQTIERCNKFAERYSKSEILDSYWYVIGYSHFALGETEKALEMCRKVAEAKRRDRATGREIESSNKWQAIYILGQVYHSIGKAAEAVAEYKKVAERFVDAKQAIEYFLRREVSVPELTAVKPGELAKVELKFRNVPNVDVKAYRIDLMKFGLLRRDLGNITAINLAGIRPFHEATIKLGDGKDYRDRSTDLSLPLKDAGAYLVVCRADELYASGLVLVTPLTMEVQEESESGRVRATVKDVIKGRYLPEAQVRVIGTQNPEFIAGSTDLRGVFVADGVLGRSTVIARAESGYAFHRGKEHLGPQPKPDPQQTQRGQQAAPTQEKALKSQEEQLLDNVRKDNRFWNDIQQKNLKRLYDNPSKGVEAKSAY